MISKHHLISKLRWHKVDMKDGQDVSDLVSKIETEHGPIDCAIANAGTDITADAEDLSFEDWRTVIETNLIGATNLIAAIYPRMIERRSGRIVLIASGAGLIGFPLGAPYTASKAGLIGLAKALRAEAAPKGVHIHLVCPPVLDTPLIRANASRSGIDRPTFLQSLPGRILSPATAADIIVKRLAKGHSEIVFPWSLSFSHKLITLFPALGDMIRRDIVKRSEIHRGI